MAAENLEQILNANPLVLFSADDDPESHMLQSVLQNIGATDVKIVNLTGSSTYKLALKQRLVHDTGQDEVPYLYLKSENLGTAEDLMQMVMSGALQERLRDAGLHVLMKTETPSLDKNIFGYPKGGLTLPDDERKNILVGCCGSSAADKIPQLIRKLKNEGHDVKLVPSVHGQHFFEDFGMEEIQSLLKPHDVYRDEDEWNFRYMEFGMQVRACHLALCDWADVVVVAPITCNTMGKIANGIADNLLSSIFVAWQYQAKPVILCPACNTHMWNNLTTQRNVEHLKSLGVRFEGPLEGTLSNGTKGIGMMATIDQIADSVLNVIRDLDDPDLVTMRWGKQAAASDDPDEWKKIYRKIDEHDEHGNKIVDINVSDKNTGDTLLHYAAGGEGAMHESGIDKGMPDLEAAKELIKRNIDVNRHNKQNFTPLHVAVMNDSPGMVSVLLKAGADPKLVPGKDGISCIDLAKSKNISPEIMRLLWESDSMSRQDATTR